MKGNKSIIKKLIVDGRSPLNYSRRSKYNHRRKYNHRGKYNHCVLCRRFQCVKKDFSFFFFFCSKLQTNSHLKQEEKVQKRNALLVKKTFKKKQFFLNRRFLFAVFVGSEQFLTNLKPYSNGPFYTKYKSLLSKIRGGSGETFLSYYLKVSIPCFSRNSCAVSITTATPPPPQS